MSDKPQKAPIPETFGEYLRSFGPGIVVVLTWLGSGDIVTAGVSGGNYGYALMWVLVLSILVRFVFVSLIAKYQLCNPHGDSILDGLVRLNRWYAPFLGFAAVVMAHVFGASMLSGCGETWVKLTGWGQTWQWSILWILVAASLVFRPVYQRVEVVFKLILAVLAATLLGTAIWVGPDVTGIARGTFAFALPANDGPFDAVLVAVSMIGALGGSIMNLAYPYFLAEKGWHGPDYRRLQTYDLLLGIIAMIILNLAVWTLGAELLHGSGKTVEDLAGLESLLGSVLGELGRKLLLIGVFAAVFTSFVGISMVLAFIASHSHLKWYGHANPSSYKSTWVYRVVILWGLVSPIIWTLPNMPDFVTITLIGNSIQVLLVPVLAAGLWRITASERYVGHEHRNRWWENLVMLLAFCLAVYASIELLKSFVI